MQRRLTESEVHSAPGLMAARAKSCARNLLRPLFAAFWVVAYFSLGVLYYERAEGWDLTTSIYFQMVTVSTVGYGDLSPSTDESKLFTVFWILLGIIVVFSQLAAAVDFFTRPVVRLVKALFERMCPQKGIDIDEDGTADFIMPRHPILYYPKQLLPSFLVAVVLQLTAAALFTKVEGWPFGIAMYHCMVTATTVGYGDTSISPGGRALATVHILLSVAIIAMFISELDDAVTRRKRAMQKLALIRAKCDTVLLQSLDLDGDGVDKAEFVVGMLAKVGLIEDADAEPFMKLFVKLQRELGNTTGKLTKEELAHAERLQASQAARVRALSRGNGAIHTAASAMTHLAGNALRSGKLAGQEGVEVRGGARAATGAQKPRRSPPGREYASGVVDPHVMASSAI